jgi:hypothetical protein
MLPNVDVASVGGTKKVGVAPGEQAAALNNAPATIIQPVLVQRRRKSPRNRAPVVACSRTPALRCLGFCLSAVLRRFGPNVQRQCNLAAQRLLANHAFNLGK